MNKIAFLPLILGVLLATACATNIPPPGATSVSSEQARNVATALYPDATPVRVELTTNNGRRAWDVELDNGWAVYVDARTGDVIEVERIGVRDDDDSDAPSDTSTAISAVEAQRIALALYPDANAIDTDLEVEDGRRVWDVELDNGVSVYIDVMTGDIVEIDYDDDTSDNPGEDPGNSDIISADQAASIALSRFPDATVIDVDLGEEDGRRVWYVDLSNGYEVYVDAVTGDILDIERDDDSGGSPGDDPGGSDLISADQAADIALARFPGATVIDVYPGEEDGRRVWYVDLSNGYEVYVDAVTGDILDIDRD